MSKKDRSFARVRLFCRALLSILLLTAILSSTGCATRSQRPPVVAEAVPRKENWLSKSLSVFKVFGRIIPKRKHTPRAQMPEWIGTIALVSREQRFVLIDSTAFYTLPTGTDITGVSGQQETSLLRVTGQRKHPFFIADIIEGDPKPGDRVYLARPSAETPQS